uniref:Reverse transcriptase zinc-binding domain-containing protein n=1 Tax=Panstrongylus lignarius TaxID=156445 RepID=A0A224XTE7_9HEMI
MRVLVGVLTGHALVASHLHKMGTPICQNCDEEVRETVYHYLCQCPHQVSYLWERFTPKGLPQGSLFKTQRYFEIL